MTDIYLDQNEFNQLQTIYNNQRANPSLDFRVDYYTLLKSFGISYGNLALGVVNNDTFSGQIANNFLSFDKTTLSDSQKIALSKDLFLRDFERRKANLEVAKTNGLDRIGELSSKDIEEIHRIVFSKYNVSLDSWTPAIPIKILGYEAGQILLSSSLTDGEKLLRIGRLAVQKGEGNNVELLEWFAKTIGAAANTEEGTIILYALSRIYPLSRVLSLASSALTKFCFTAETQILMSDGTYKSIEQIKIGDEVMAFVGLGELQPRKVTQTFITPDREIVQLGNIKVTLGHHFLQADGSFKALGEIDPDGFLVGVTGKVIPHPGIKPVEGKHTVYNFTVEDLHTYVAGDYRVHNESVSDYQPVTTAGFIGAAIGSQIGSLFADDKFASQLVAQSLGKTVGSTVGDAIAYEFNLSDDPAFLARTEQSLSLAAIYKRLPASFISTGISLGSAKLASSLIKTFKIEDPLTQIGVNTLVTGSVSHIITLEVAKSYPVTAVTLFGAPSKVVGGTVTADLSKLSFSGTLGSIGASAFASFAGSYLYQKLIRWNILSENISTSGVAIGATIGATIGSIIPGIGTAIGAFVGTLLGSVVGGLFGDRDFPRAFGNVIVVNNQFFLTSIAVDDKGNYDIAYSMGNSAKDSLTMIVGLVGGKVFSIRDFRYGHYLKDYVYRPSDVGLGAYDYPYRFSSPQDAILAGVIQQVQSVQIEGGDLYVKRILSALPSDVKTLEQLNATFQVAREWGIYRDNSVLYDQNINYLKANAIKDTDAKIIDLRSRPTEAFDPNSQAKYFGNALKFDGNDYVAFQSSVAPTGNQSYTIEAWVKPDKTGALGIVGWGTYGKSNAVNGLKLEADGIRNYWQDNDIKAAIKVSLNEWHHIAANYDSATGIRKIYLDGQKVAEGKSSSPNIATNSNFTIGKTFDQEYFSGQIDDVRVWNVARTDDQIAAQMNRQLKGNETGLVGYWNLNEGKGTAVQDLTASNKLGVIQGANWVPYDAKLRDFDINVLPSQIQLSLQGNNLIINGEIIPNWLTTSDRLEILRFADGSRLKIVASNGTVRLDDERVANWEEIKTKATQLNLDAAKPSDNYLAPNASQIVINTNSPLLVSKNLTNPNSYTASSSANPSSSPDKAFDGLGTTWNAGGYGNHWIEVDLGEQYQLSSIKLKVEQAPSGNTIHEVRISNQPIGASATGATLATTFKVNTVDGQWLSGDFSNSPVGRYVQIKTTQSPSWIAWEEIEVYGKSLTSSIIGNISDDVLIATVSGQTLNGSKGDDIYRYNRGQGIITIKDAGGLDTLEFDASIKSSDLLVQQSGIDLIIALKNPSNPSATVAQLTDKVVISNFFNQKIEVIRFGNNQEVAIESLIPSFSVNGIAKPVTTIPNTVTFSNSSYYLTTASSWTNAQDQAKAMGGNLVTINSQAEQDLLFTTFGKNESLWIGLNDAKQEGKFEWVSGESVTYTNWAAGQPDNYGGNEDYALMWNPRSGLWNDGNENTNVRGIVEVNRLFTGNDKGNLYQYRLGDGNEVIYDIGNYEGITRDGGLDILEFGAGITLSSLKLTLDNNNLIVKVNDTNTITIRDWIKAQSKIETFRFSDGKEYNPTLSFNGTVPLQATFSAGNPNYNLAADKPEIFATSPYKLLTVDLAGDGLQLISAQESMTLSDPDNDTYPEQTGWVAPSDGFLVMDRSNDGVITGLNEFFSLQKQNNVSFLSDLDTNKDLIIDTKDANFQQLRIWIDNNLNGDVELGELSALYRYGINSISVIPQTKNFNVAGNSITASAYFTRIGFETKPVSQLYDVAFTYKRDGLKIEQLGSGVSRFNYENKPDIVFADDSGQNINLTIDPNEIYSATGGKGNDIFTVKAGSTKGAVLSGGDGDDRLIGSNGNDILTGGAGRDAIDGGAGDDVITIDKFDDLNNIKGGTGFDVVVIEGDGDVSFTLDNLGVEVVNGNQGNNTLTAIGTQDVIISGNGGIDVITGGQGSDRLEGNEGNDVLNGGAGDDNLNGGTGDDAINGGDGEDTVYLNGTFQQFSTVFNQGFVKVSSTQNNNDTDTLTNIEYLQFSDGLKIRIKATPNFEIANSLKEFSGVQGQNNWYYGYYNGPFTNSNFHQMNQFSDIWTVQNGTYWTLLTAGGGHPNGVTTSSGRKSEEQWAVRRWVSEIDGEVQIYGNLAKLGLGGNGVIGHIFVDGVEIWSQSIAGTNATGINYQIQAKVKLNSVVDFAIDPKDANDPADTTDFTAQIDALNQTPTNLTLSNSNIGENQAIGTLIGNLSTTDPDSGNTFTYSLVTGTGSTDNALFAIAGNQLKTNSVFDYEIKKSYSIRIKTTDQGGLFYEKALTINISDLPDTNIETAGNTKLVKDGANKYFAQAGANIPIAIKNGGQQIFQNIYGSDWQTIAAETVNGVNQVLWKNVSGNYLHIWRLDSNWNRISSEGQWALNSADALNQETKFGIDANSDSVIGNPYTAIETAGNTKLVKDTSNKLFAQVGTNSPIAITNGGSQFSQTTYSGWEILAVETVNGDNQVLWKNVAGNFLHIWHLDNNWNRISSEGQWALNSADALNQETKFGIDANSDSVIGNPYTAIEPAGNTKLVKDSTNKYFTQIGTNNPTAIKNAGQQIYQNIYGSGWQTLAAETVNGVNQVLWKNVSGNYLHIWRLDSNWNWVSSEGNWGLNSPDALTQETNFGIDANGDGKIGYAIIESAGNTSFLKDAANKYFTQIGTNTPIAIKNGGQQIYQNIYSGWQTLATETVNGVNQVLWKNVSGNYLHIWRLDSNWNRTASEGVWDVNSAEALTQESVFGIDANGDNKIGNLSSLTLTGTTGNDILIGGANNDVLTGAGVKDTLTGGLGNDKFVYQNLTDSLLANFDVITDFNATTGNDLFRVSTARAGFVDVGVVNTLDATGIGTKLTAAAFGSNFAAKFGFGQRTFVAINDATAGFNAATDGIIEVTGLTGTLNIANFTTV